MIDKPFAAATERNSQPILGVIRHEFAAARTILEIGSGTGQHAVCFGAALDHLTWQTSELEENHAGIHAWLNEAGLDNVRAPLLLDVRSVSTLPDSFDGVFSANTAHIMSFAAVEKMFSLVSTVLNRAGSFCLYGPFRRDGDFGAPSNQEFHKSLRDRDEKMGIRHIEDLDRLAAAGGMHRSSLFAMPANNFLAVWKKESSLEGA